MGTKRTIEWHIFNANQYIQSLSITHEQYYNKIIIFNVIWCVYQNALIQINVIYLFLLHIFYAFTEKTSFIKCVYIRNTFFSLLFAYINTIIWYFMIIFSIQLTAYACKLNERFQCYKYSNKCLSFVKMILFAIMCTECVTCRKILCVQ